MFRIKHLVSTAAVLVVSAGVLAPAAQAKGDGMHPNLTSTTTVVGFFDPAPKVDNRLGARIHDTPLANPVEPKVEPKSAVTGRTISTSGGIDWTFPVMGAVAIGLIIMVAGDQILFRRRGQLAT